MSIHRSASMSGKIVEWYVKRIKGKKPVLTPTQVIKVNFPKYRRDKSTCPLAFINNYFTFSKRTRGHSKIF